jgi:uncharacterized protein
MTAGDIRVEVIQAWPRRFESGTVMLPEGATVAEAIAAAGLGPGGHVAVAVHGEKAALDDVLRDGDRVELLRPLTMDPKDARRLRAGK